MLWHSLGFAVIVILTRPKSQNIRPRNSPHHAGGWKEALREPGRAPGQERNPT